MCIPALTDIPPCALLLLLLLLLSSKPDALLQSHNARHVLRFSHA